MKTLIVEDDFTSRLLLQKILAYYGESHVAINGREAVIAYEQAFAEGEPYDLITMDIMMPEMDGQSALKAIRAIEANRGIEVGDGVKIFMTTALKSMPAVIAAYKEFCNAYLVKPIDKGKLIEEIKNQGLI